MTRFRAISRAFLTADAVIQLSSLSKSFGGRVLLAFEPLDLRDQLSAARFELGELAEIRLRLQSPIPQPLADNVNVFTHESRVEHR